MAKISALTPLAKLVGDELIALAKDGRNYSIAVSSLIESLGPNFKGILPNVGALPAPANSKRGEIYVIDSHFWAYGEDPQNPGTLKWNDLGSFLGPQGDQGEQGIQGIEGPAGKDGMLPDYTPEVITAPVTPDEFNAAVNAAIGMAKPATTVGKSYTVQVNADTQSKGMWTIMPTEKGRYIWLAGYKALGADSHSTAVIYIPDSTGVPTFLSYTASERGEKGEPGPAGKDGANAVGMTVVGLADTAEELPDPSDFDIGDTYIVGTHFHMKIGVEWVDIGDFSGPAGNSAYKVAILNGFVGTEQDWLKSLKGADGIGIRIIGSLDTKTLLPEEAEYTGDAYIIREDEKMYVWDGTGWASVGQVGPDGKPGKDSYEIAIDQGFRGTRDEWLLSLKGAKGDQGLQGEPGPQGLPGRDGTNASSVVFKGGVGTANALPTTDNTVSDAYMVEDVGHLFIWTGSSWYDTGVFTAKGEQGIQGEKGEPGKQGEAGKNGVDGKSAYQLAQAAGFAGTDLEWLASLIGPGIVARGTVGDVDDLKNIVNPQMGYAYNVIGGAKIGHQYIYDGTHYVDMGDIRGAKGAQGEKGDPGSTGLPGATAIPKGSIHDSTDLLDIPNPQPGWMYNVTDGTDAGHQFVYNGTDWIDMGNLRGLVGAQGIQGPEGAPGKNAGAVNFKGTVTDANTLPTEGNLVSDAYFVGTHLYVWEGASWIDCGSFQGLKGEQGETGEEGQQGPDGVDAYGVAQRNGFEGTEAQWLQSLVGAPVFAKGAVETIVALNAVQNPVNGWLYNVTENGHMYIRNGAAWVDCGDVRGIQGIQGLQGVPGPDGADGEDGKDGTSFSMLGRVASEADRPADPKVGNAVFVGTELQIWDGTAWVSLGDFIGPEGEQGPQGEMGAGIKILGKKDTEEDLPTTGEVGDGYMIGVNFWVWDGTAYIDVGPIRGPKGDQGIRGIQGLKGEKGDPGDKGEKGEQGTIIIILDRDPGPLDGRINDYFMSTIDQRLYRKTSETAWAYMGTFGGGNVYECPDDGKQYLKVHGSWVEYVAPEVEEAPKDGHRYFRKDGGWDVFNVYDVKVAKVTNGVCDCAAAQWFKLDGTKATTVSFVNLPPVGGDRATTIPMTIKGKGGLFSWPANLKWSGGAQPALADTMTLIIFSWDGEFLTGSLSQSY